MKTTGFLILNTISNICTFITLALVLLILYYLKENYDFVTKRQQNIKKVRNNINSEKEPESNYSYNNKSCSKRFDIFKKPNNTVVHSEIQEERINSSPKMNLNNFRKNNTMQEESNDNCNSFTPPIQETITFVPERKNISNNNYRSYLNNCS